MQGMKWKTPVLQQGPWAQQILSFLWNNIIRSKSDEFNSLMAERAADYPISPFSALRSATSPPGPLDRLPTQSEQCTAKFCAKRKLLLNDKQRRELVKSANNNHTINWAHWANIQNIDNSADYDRIRLGNKESINNNSMKGSQLHMFIAVKPSSSLVKPVN